MVYPKNFEEKIGFATVRAEIDKRCMSTLGKSHCEAMRFSVRCDEVTAKLRQTNEFLSIIVGGKDFPLNHFIDVRPALRKLSAPHTYVSEDQLFDIQRSLITIDEILRFFASHTTSHDLPEWKSAKQDEKPLYPALAALVKDMQGFPNVVAEIAQVLDKYGNVRDDASPELASLRRSLSSTTASINSIMRSVISQARQAGYLDKDAQPSIRDGRLVLPVAPAHKRKIRGIVHDESATGKTVFIEPAEIVEANNNIREIEGEIKREIIRILVNLCDQIRPSLPAMEASYEVMGEIDFIRAKALFAKDIDGQMPTIHKHPGIELYHAVHPGLLLSLREQGKDVVPINITLSRENRILLISGPNAGGKSVCLKTVGMIVYMTQCGVLPSVYSNSHIGIYDSLFIDIGDQQSIENDLSTYSSHLLNMKNILGRGNDRSMILIDEFGGGTEPQFGGAIAQALLARFNERKMHGVVTTHYQNLKHFAEDAPGIINGAMLYDRQAMKPLFQLSVGYPGSSFAIEIARKIGLPKDVVDDAAEIVGSDYVNMDKYLLDIARDRKYWESKRNEIHIKEKKLDSLLSEYNERVEDISREHKDIIRAAKHEAKEILAQSNANIERTIREIKEAQAEKEKTKELRRQLDEFRQRIGAEESGTEQNLPKPIVPKNKKGKKQLPKSEPVVQEEIIVGCNVTMEGGNTVGTVMEINGKNATVEFGLMRTKVDVAKLRRTMRAPQSGKSTAPTLTRATSDSQREKQLNFSREIDVRGMRTDEAIQAVTYLIDDAVQFGISEVRILHGTGSGILRVQIRKYLNTVPDVISYRDEHIQFGGPGITIVTLR